MKIDKFEDCCYKILFQPKLLHLRPNWLYLDQKRRKRNQRMKKHLRIWRISLYNQRKGHIKNQPNLHQRMKVEIFVNTVSFSLFFKKNVS